MKQTITFIVYARGTPKSFTGILGQITLHCTWLLLIGGKSLIEETYTGSDPVEWYTKVLKDQEMTIKSTKTQKFKGGTYVWIEIDADKTPLEEYVTWRDLEPNDTTSLAWKPFWTPYAQGTSNECLGFAVKAREYALQNKQSPLTLQQVLDAIL